jgi:hypothetical protein
VLTLSAISYDIQPGFETEIAEIFSPKNFKRANTPIIRNAAGKVVGRIIGTGLFLRGDAMARIIQYEGELEDVARHMAAQDGVHEAERAIAPYLRVPRDTETEAGFLNYFHNAAMETLALRIYRDRPLTGIAAVCDRVPPGSAAALRPILAEAWPEVSGPGGGHLDAALAFMIGDKLIRALVYEGDLDDVLGALEAAGSEETAARLARATGTDSFLTPFRESAMRCLSCLSVGMLAVRH